MSIIDQQKELEYYPDDVLAQEMMQPTGIAPSFLVATEIKRRNDMRNSYQMQKNQPPQMSVAEEQAMELQGIPDIDPNMMQQQMMQDPMIQEQMPQNAPMQMREGGAVRYQSGTQMTQDEADKIFARLFSSKEEVMKKFPQYFNPDGSQKSPQQMRAEGLMDADKYLFGELYDQSMPRNERGQIVQRRLGLEESNLPENVYEDFSNIADEQIALRDALRETEQSEMIDPDGGFLSAGITGPMGNKMLGKDGWLYDPTSVLDNTLLAASAIPIGGRALTGAGLLGKAGIKGLIKGGKALKGKIAEGIGSIASKRGFVPNYRGRNSIPLSEVGIQAAKAFTNPFPLSLSSPFWSKTAPILSGSTFLATRGGDDSGIDASIIQDVNATEVDTETISADNMSIEELQALIAEREAAEAERIRILTEKLAEDAERDRRAALPDSARMLEDAMANVPENETFQDYLSTLEGMEESRKGQVLMDLGASIANASHGGDIAKGFQEAGTRARAEKIEAAKEKARVLGESRLMDINTSLKMAEIDAALMKSDQITLSGWLDLFADNPDLIQAVEDADDPIAEIIKILSRLGVNTDNMEAVIKETGTK